MRQKTRILLYILIAIAVVIIGSIAILSSQRTEEHATAQEHLDLGRIYLNDLSYDKAVIEFTEAIEIEPMNSDAYLGLANAYVNLGDTDKAVDALEAGYEKIKDERFKDKLDEIKPPAEETTVDTTTVTTEETTTTFSTATLVAVPNLSGLTEEEAIAACENAGLSYSISYGYSDRVEKGYVMAQTIPENTNVAEGIIVPFTVNEGIKEVTITTTENNNNVNAKESTVNAPQFYAEDFLGMTFKEAFTILGKGKLSGWNGGYGYYWENFGLELTANQDEVIFNFPEEPIIPEEAHVICVITWSKKIPANKDLKIGMRLIDVVNKYGLNESDIYISDMDDGFHLSIENEYNYAVYISTSDANNYNEKITEIVLQEKDYYEKIQ